MESSYKIFSIFGIAVELHITFILFFLFLLLIIVGGYGLSAGITATILIVVLFGTVLAHELAHSLVAKRSGREVNKITLLPIGGLASVDIPENPKVEFVISLAGPLFNFIFAGILMLIFASVYPGIFEGYMTGAINDYIQVYIYNNQEVETNLLDVSTIPGLIGTLIWVNLVLGFFNLFIPAFPLDGGRVLRSLLAMQMNYVSATRYAIYIGQAIFGLMLVIGIIRLWPVWIFIALFLLLAAPSELKIVEIRHQLKGYSMRDVALKNLIYANESITIANFLKTIAVPEQSFYPVTNNEEKIIGYINLDNLEELNEMQINTYTVKNILRTDFGKISVSAPAEDILKLIDRDFVFVTDRIDDNEKVVGFITLNYLIKLVRFQKYHKIIKDKF